MKKILLKLMGLALLARCSYFKHETRKGVNTGCCWNKFTEINSIETLGSEQHIEGNLRTGESEEPEKQQNTRESC